MLLEGHPASSLPPRSSSFTRPTLISPFLLPCSCRSTTGGGARFSPGATATAGPPRSARPMVDVATTSWAVSGACCGLTLRKRASAAAMRSYTPSARWRPASRMQTRVACASSSPITALSSPTCRWQTQGAWAARAAAEVVVAMGGALSPPPAGGPARLPPQLLCLPPPPSPPAATATRRAAL